MNISSKKISKSYDIFKSNLSLSPTVSKEPAFISYDKLKFDYSGKIEEVGDFDDIDFSSSMDLTNSSNLRFKYF